MNSCRECRYDTFLAIIPSHTGFVAAIARSLRCILKVLTESNMFILAFSIALLHWVHQCNTFSGLASGNVRLPGRHALLLYSTNCAGDDFQNMLDEASRLRQEAEELEAKLRASSAEAKPAQPKEIISIISYSDMKDSVWTFSYRFSDRPESDEGDQGAVTKRDFFVGKLCLKFRSDGFTDLISHNPQREGTEVTKAWGWDLERSNDDDKDYILFSIDAKLPGNSSSQRFYFQARQDFDKGNSIALKEGTITIKQDLIDSKKTPGMWGLFSPRGILAQFRYVGDFTAKPSGM